jgi:cell wall integrity and stress response component
LIWFSLLTNLILQSTSTQRLTWTATPITTVQTITGQVQTITITPTAPPKSSALTAQQYGKAGFFSDAGKVAGLFVGLAMIILLVAAGAIFFCWRRRHRNDKMLPPMADTNGSTPIRSRSRSMSELGLMDGVSQGEKQTLPHITTGMWNMSGGSGGSPTGLSPTNKRNSAARIVDQRLDPGAVWSPEHDNSSRISVRSLQDDRDYSRRVLRVSWQFQFYVRTALG